MRYDIASKILSIEERINASHFSKDGQWINVHHFLSASMRVAERCVNERVAKNNDEARKKRNREASKRKEEREKKERAKLQAWKVLELLKFKMGEEDLEDLKVKKDDVELSENNLKMLKHRKHSQGLAYLLEKNILGDILHKCLKESLGGITSF